MTATARDPKSVALAFMHTVFEERKVREGFERFVRPDYIQHNPALGDGPEPAIAYLTALLDFKPDIRAEVRHVIAEDNHVVITSSLRDGEGPATSVLVDIFRIEDGLIAEHWDIMQPIPGLKLNPRPLL